ncbi:MAG: PH domain-containing protein, partial [Bifidobacteriaceae bacterium]|nr:PH domain-containing protein [Bifidobacteriaceae bacterium]
MGTVPITEGAPSARGDPLFDPPDLVWRRVSPKLARAWQITAAITYGLILAAVAVPALITQSLWLAAPAGLTLALWAWTAWLIPRRVRAIGYAEREADLIIRKGIMFRTLEIVPYGRMQYLDVTAGPLDRALGLAKLKLNTAASSLTATLPGLEPTEATRLRDHLAAL